MWDKFGTDSRLEHSKGYWCCSSCLTCRQPESERVEKAYHLCMTCHSQKLLRACQKPKSHCLRCRQYSHHRGASCPLWRPLRRGETRPTLPPHQPVFSSRFPPNSHL